MLAKAVLPANADDSPSIEFIDAAAQICPTMLMRPDKSEATLADLGIEDTTKIPELSATWTWRTYQRRAGQMVITSSDKLFSDLRVQTCYINSLSQKQMLDISALRARLEADPDIGRLEGDLATPSSTEARAMLKRCGNSPVVTIAIFATEHGAALSMTRIDFDVSGVRMAPALRLARQAAIDKIINNTLDGANQSNTPVELLLRGDGTFAGLFSHDEREKGRWSSQSSQLCLEPAGETSKCFDI